MRISAAFLNRFPVLVLLVLLVGLDQAWSADNIAVIEQRLKDNVGFLADDALEGRGIDTPGIAKAADYIRAQFKQAGLQSGAEDGSYFQPFDVVIKAKADEKKTSLVLHGPAGQQLHLQAGTDYQPMVFGGDGQFQAPIVFAGYGITADEYKYDDYQEIDVAGKVVLILRREPQQGDEKSVFDGTQTTSYSGIESKIRNAWAHHAAAVLLVSDPFTVTKPEDDQLVPVDYISFQEALSQPLAQLKQDVVDRVLATTPLKTLRDAEAAIDAGLVPVSQPLEGWTAEGAFAFERIKAHVANVVGVIEGQGPHADETIAIGAHYDHLGYGGKASLAPGSREIHNGADDNASGTAAVIELARRFGARNTRPARRLLFIAFAAEETGLHGSTHYVNAPLYPLDKTVAMLNFDMVGRLSSGTLTLLGTGTAREFDPLLERLAKEHALKLKKNAAAIAVFGGSDHMVFYKAKVPVLHFFTGTHRDYHRPSDDADKINVRGIRRVVGLAESLIDSVLDTPRPPTYVRVKPKDPHGGLGVSGGKMAYLGTVPDYGTEIEGVLLNDIREDSPADKGGMKPGDVIIDIAGMPIKNVHSLTLALRQHKAGETVKVTVKRGQETKALEVTLGSR